jgi:hypothetical protein
VLRKLLAFAAMTIVLATVFVIGDAPSAGACSCTTNKPVMSTFVGRVDSVNGDSFSFVDVVTTSGDAVSNPVVVNILAGRKPDANGRRMFTSCDVGGDQPLVGGVYRVTVDPLRPSVGSCGGSFSLVEAPPAQAETAPGVATTNVADSESNSRRPTVAIILGGALLVIAAGMAIQGRKRTE